jgi:siroheme synthase (precorrin-2 oxidase/ferrochelatase)
LFQLIGCAKQPAITVQQNQNENDLELSKLKSAIFWDRVGLGVIALIGLTAIIILATNNRKLANEIKQIEEENTQLANKLRGIYNK